MIFHNASIYCHNWLISQPHVKEESLTDWLLFHLSNETSKVIYKTFTRNEEAYNGSDWEWWILTYSYAYRLLIQAKKLNFSGDNYPLITYSNKNGMQIDLLIQEAKMRNALPLYALYSCCQPNINEQCLNISYLPKSLLEWCKNCINGCYFTSAIELQRQIFNNPRRNVSAQELIDSSFGLSLLDMIWQNDVDPDNFLTGLNSHYKDNCDKDNFHSLLGIRHKYTDLPTYVKFLIERNQEDLSWLDLEFRHEVENLSGVAIIDTRQNLKR